MLDHRKALVYIGILNLCYVVCLGVSAPYALLMPYLANRFTYFLHWLMLSLFLGPRALCASIWKCVTDIYKLPPRTQSITTIDAHCSKKADLYP